MGERRIIEIRPSGDTWHLSSDGPVGGLVFPSKQEALGVARDWARKNLPAMIVVFARDGVVDKEYLYDDNASMRGPEQPRSPRRR